MRTLTLNENKQVTGGFVLPGSSTVSSFSSFGGVVNGTDRLAHIIAARRTLSAAEQAIVDIDPVQERAVRFGLPLF